jgi:hypothetical protein
MGSTRRSVRLLLGPAAALALMLIGSAPAPAAPAGDAKPTWTLRDIGQTTCVTSSSGHPGTYFLAPVFGTWSTTITTGMRNLPPGSTSVGGTPIPPGSNNGNTILGFVQISIAPAPVGVYTPEVWASDGTTTQAVPVTVKVQERC